MLSPEVRGLSALVEDAPSVRTCPRLPSGVDGLPSIGEPCAAVPRDASLCQRQRDPSRTRAPGVRSEAGRGVIPAPRVSHLRIHQCLLDRQLRVLLREHLPQPADELDVGGGLDHLDARWLVDMSAVAGPASFTATSQGRFCSATPQR
jgi:hypothetical protein